MIRTLNSISSEELLQKIEEEGYVEIISTNTTYKKMNDGRWLPEVHEK